MSVRVWERGISLKAVSHPAEGTGSSAVPLIYRFASCDPAQGDVVEGNSAAGALMTDGRACFACVRILIVNTCIVRGSLGLGPRMGIMAWWW